MENKRESARQRYADEAAAREAEMAIVDAEGVIVGWTRIAPEARGTIIIHAEASRLVGPVKACYIEFEDSVAAQRAGAPPGWRGAWRCLGICSDKIQVEPLQAGEPLRTFRMRLP
jgi:hypothetical protein